ncbi:unnamed protein product [Ectocarpus sp. CCAP 1310/34]|nr:unnamed protein product [Ectocarpus sp. CCAP 1310/34]
MGLGRAALFAFVVAIEVAPCAGSAEDRAVLSVVTPDTLGVEEEVVIRWSYEDGNGGEERFFLCITDRDGVAMGQQ